jgi:gentisate 1,2-dioxygenase
MNTAAAHTPAQPSSPPSSKPPSSVQAARQQLYQDIDPLNLTPLWEVLHNLVPVHPKSPCLPALWRYEQVRPYLMRAGELITAEEAVRRVLILENPGIRGKSSVTQSLYAGLQLILPGEVAPSHRHTQSALRFIVEGSGAFTAVNGERTTMKPGDFIITPSWAWHDHGNEVQEPMVWLDGLDIPIVGLLDAGFAQNNPEKSQTLKNKEGSSFARYGYNMVPVRGDGPFGKTSPIFSYPYERSREALHQLEQSEAVDAWDGFKLRYVNPLTGGYPMPTMATFMQRLPAGFSGKANRQTDSAVYSVVEGSGTAVMTYADGTEAGQFQFTARDHFVVPSWVSLQLKSDPGCVLFSFSDRPVQDALGIHQEERFS